MGFGGGGSGSFVLPNHTHTNVLLDGGSLEELVSLVDGATMKVWIDNKIALAQGVEKLDEALVAGAASDTFTPAVTISFDDYSEIFGVITGEQSASNDLGLVVNATGGVVYSSFGSKSNAGTLTGVAVAQAYAMLLQAAAMPLTEFNFGGVIRIWSDDESSTRNLIGHSTFMSARNVIAENFFHDINIGGTTNQITSLKVQVAAGTFSGRISWYGVKRP